MKEDVWIVVPNWDRFQHYRDRAPTWIKVYTELNSRDDWLDLTDAERGLLVLVWIEFARSDGRIKTGSITNHSRNKSRSRALKRLNDAGWIEFSASRPLALARARVETEKRRPPKPPVERGVRKSKKTGWRIVRGSHGTTHVRDPDGTDRPPVDAPLLKEVT